MKNYKLLLSVVFTTVGSLGLIGIATNKVKEKIEEYEEVIEEV